jgi:Spy/CpxP family protein refolding chaperone
MKSFVTKCAVAAAVLSLVAVVFAADEKGKKRPDPTAGMLKKLKGVELTADQQAKVKAIADEHRPKIQAAQAKANEGLTREQKKARADAVKAAKAAGKNMKEANAAGREALNLTAEQETAFEKAQTELREANAAFTKAIAEVLTPEQRQQAKIGGKKKKKKA